MEVLAPVLVTKVAEREMGSSTPFPEVVTAEKKVGASISISEIISLEANILG